MNAERRAIGLEIGPVHFIGIGGAGMSGIAELMRNMGYRVQGSDLAKTPACLRLEGLGIPVHQGHAPKHLGEAAIAVYSSAIPPDNVERLAAKEKGIPLLSRADMLAELMRFKRSIAVAGTHGKTTTTSLIASVLDAADMKPTVINGGLINAYGSHSRLGTGEWLVAEADESDGSFLRLPAEIAVITNIDPEHLEHYGDFDSARQAYHLFAESIPLYGFAVICRDHPETRRLAESVEDKRVITYGFSEGSRIRGRDAHYRGGGMDFRAEEAAFHLPMPGEHNALNALAAIALALELGVSLDAIAEALRNFSGVKRRFSRIGVSEGVVIYDDYAHHPVEIAAVLRAARDMTEGRVIALAQPHRYTRLQQLLDEFAQSLQAADIVMVSPVYAAGETPIRGVHRDALIRKIADSGHQRVIAIEGMEDAALIIARDARDGDIVVCMGAGSITNWAKALPATLSELHQRRAS